MVSGGFLVAENGATLDLPFVTFEEEVAETSAFLTTLGGRVFEQRREARPRRRWTLNLGGSQGLDIGTEGAIRDFLETFRPPFKFYNHDFLGQNLFTPEVSTLADFNPDVLTTNTWGWRVWYGASRTFILPATVPPSTTLFFKQEGEFYAGSKVQFLDALGLVAEEEPLENLFSGWQWGIASFTTPSWCHRLQVVLPNRSNQSCVVLADSVHETFVAGRGVEDVSFLWSGTSQPWRVGSGFSQRSFVIQEVG